MRVNEKLLTLLLSNIFQLIKDITNSSAVTDNTAIIPASILTPAHVQKNTRSLEAPSVIIVPAPIWLLNKSEERKLTTVAPNRSNVSLILGLILFTGWFVLRNFVINLLISVPKNINRKTLNMLPTIDMSNTTNSGKPKPTTPIGIETNTSKKGTILPKKITAY